VKKQPYLTGARRFPPNETKLYFKRIK
jgi:hypothetical protein